MLAKTLAPLALVAMLGLAACDQSPDPAAPAANGAAETSDTAVEDGISDALSSLQDAGDSLSDAARAAWDGAEGDLAEARDAIQAMSGEVQSAIGAQVSSLVLDLEERRDANMTDAQKADAVADTRANAESLAATAGLSDAQVTEAGNSAEEAARRVLGYDGPIVLE